MTAGDPSAFENLIDSGNIELSRAYPIDLSNEAETADNEVGKLTDSGQYCEVVEEPPEEVEVEVSVTQSQYEAIISPVVPNQILKINAGPGAGKTTTLVNKICYLISNGMDPETILVLSMTNRAVDNLKVQLENLLGYEKASSIRLHTFHGFCLKTLREYEQVLECSVMEESEWKTLELLSPLKFRSSKQFKQFVADIKQGTAIEKMSSLYTEADIKTFQQVLNDFNVTTYDDIITRCLDLLSRSPEILDSIQCVIVDEFQDMYKNLLEVVKIVSKDKHLIIAGDCHQSIYEFLGSNHQLLDNIEKVFPLHSVKEIHLDECFRSTPEIMSCAERAIGDIERRIVLNPSGPNPVLKTFPTEIDGYEFVAQEIVRILSLSGGLIKPGDIGILGITNSQLTGCKEILDSYGLKSDKLVQSPEWIDTEVFALIDYLKVINSSGNEFSFLSLLSAASGVGPVTLKNLYIKARAEDRSLWDVVKSEKGTKAAIVMQNIQTGIEDARAIVQNDPDNLRLIIEVVCKLATDHGIKKKLNNVCTTEFKRNEMKRNLNLFYNSFCSAANTKPSDTDLIEYFVSTYERELVQREEETINLSTVHSAKGMEFPVVFFLGAPFFHRKYYAFEENKRVLYVALTRAKYMLYSNAFPDQPMSESLRQKFTAEVPKLDQKYISSLAHGLKREVPTVKQFDYGQNIYNKFENKDGTRSYHTYALNQNSLRAGKPTLCSVLTRSGIKNALRIGRNL